MIGQEQDRIRQNMGQLERNTDLYKRYVQKFGAQEDMVEKMRESDSKPLGRRNPAAAIARRFPAQAGYLSGRSQTKVIENYGDAAPITQFGLRPFFVVRSFAFRCKLLAAHVRQE